MAIMAIMCFSNENFTCPKEQPAQRTQLSPYFADAMHQLFKKQYNRKPNINSIEKSVDPDQLGSSEAS